MKKAILVFTFISVYAFIAIANATAYETAEALMKKSVKILQEMIALIEQINTPVDAQSRMPRLNQLQAEIMEIQAQATNLDPQLSVAEQKHLKEKWETVIIKLTTKLNEATTRMQQRVGSSAPSNPPAEQ